MTAQKNRPISRSDKYLMRKILQDVKDEYCIDLVKDTTDALLRPREHEGTERETEGVGCDMS